LGKLFIGNQLQHIGVAKNSLFCLYTELRSRKILTQMNKLAAIVPKSINGHSSKGIQAPLPDLEKPF
jgi:hypothetical protein